MQIGCLNNLNLYTAPLKQQLKLAGINDQLSWFNSHCISSAYKDALDN